MKTELKTELIKLSITTSIIGAAISAFYIPLAAGNLATAQARLPLIWGSILLSFVVMLWFNSRKKAEVDCPMTDHQAAETAGRMYESCDIIRAIEAGTFQTVADVQAWAEKSASSCEQELRGAGRLKNVSLSGKGIFRPAN